VLAGDAGGARDAGGSDDAASIDAFGSCAPCQAGEACVDRACVADCRLAGAVPCEVPRLCGPTSGTCVMPGQECTPRGEFVACGAGEFPPTCGPGSRCVDARCVADASCTDVVCNAVGVCLGIGCPGSGVVGAIESVSLEAVGDASVGASVPVAASLTSASHCGLTATFELRRELSLVTTAYNDDTIWEIDLGTGRRTAHATGLGSISGIANDARGQLYVVDGSCRVGTIRLLASGLNFDWPRGYDGDLIVNTEIVSETTVPFDASGRASATLTAPSTPGPFVVRVLVTDPSSGRILTATRAARAR
jgi:hypothetical protein